MAASNSVIVAMVPYPLFTHINPLFLVARLIASHNIPVHFLCLPEFNQHFEPRLQGESFGASNIHFHDILIPPADCESTGDDRLRSIVELLEKHFEPVWSICRELSTSAKKLVIIYDSIMKDYMGDVHSLPNVETCIFHMGSALSKYSMLRESIDDLDVVVDADHEKLLQQMQDEFPAMDSCCPPGMQHFIRALHEWDLDSGEFMISSREIEGKYIDLVADAKRKKPLWAFGPLHMLLQSHDRESSTISSSSSPRHECLEFLDNQDANSVIYVSFGSTPKLSQEQVNELAFGLEKSSQRFIWVLGKGDHDKDTNNKKGVEKFEKKFGKIELPQGFEERVKGRGMAVRTWVPQLEILGHPSTGGFLSHCGWSSSMESISMGVPVVAWPNEWEQPYNAVLITNVLKIGITLWSWTRKDELVTSTAIEKSVKSLMDTTEGEEMRKRAVELSNKIKSSVSPGGEAAKEVESFISYITGSITM